MRILCTNDDGYLALGIEVLASAARALGSVTVVAPDREQSATSNSLTMHHPLRVRRSTDGALVVDGTPTDCVILAVNELMDEPRISASPGSTTGLIWARTCSTRARWRGRWRRP